jgi:Raf kinase inhibitor-like YbhB/YbcL family protein
MQLKSSAFDNNQGIPKKFTCDGDNISPPLEILEVPAGAKSLVLALDDPDAPEGWQTHWLVWNIRPEKQEIKKNTAPAGAIVGTNDFGERKYMAPCPSSSTHAFLFKLYAVDIILPKNPELTRMKIRKMIEGHILEKTLLRGFYERAHGENF